MLQPWAEISERLRRYSDSHAPKLSLRSNPGLELANAFGVIPTSR